MPQSYPKSFKNCSTCESWEGKRDVNSDSSIFTVNSPTTKGKCKHQDDTQQHAFMSCEKWS